MTAARTAPASPARAGARRGRAEPVRVLLVEVLDAAGSDPADVAGRRTALRALGASVRVVIVRAGTVSGIPAPVPASPGPEAHGVWEVTPADLPRLRDFARSGGFEVVLVAAASPSAGAIGRALASVAATWWWPTGVGAAPGWGPRLGDWLGAPRGPLALSAPDGGHGDDAGLGWSSVPSTPPIRGRHTLWDGDYLLVPAPLAGDAASRLLSAFEAVAEDSSGLDLVVLAEPQAAFERAARDLGIAPRVHFAGPAPREAEWVWWSNAAGAVLAGAGPLSGGLVLRGLRSRCPILVAQIDPAGVAVGDWLARNGCAPAGPGEDLPAALSRLVRRGGEILETMERGEALAALHGEDRLPGRLAAALPVLAAASADAA